MQGNLLRAEIVSNGYTLRDVEELTGIKRSTLSAKFNGKRPFDLDEVILLCDALNITDPVKKINIFLTSPSRNRYSNEQPA